MSNYLTTTESMTVIDSGLKKGKSIIEIITTHTGISATHIAIVADEFLKKLKETTYELMKVKSLTGSTRPSIERCLSKSLVLFLHVLNENGGEAHYNDIRSIVKDKYNATVNDYSILKYYRLIEKSKSNGFWKINERGKYFLSGELKLSERLQIKDDKVISASHKLVSVNDYLDLNKNSVSDTLIQKRKDGLLY